MILLAPKENIIIKYLTITLTSWSNIFRYFLYLERGQRLLGIAWKSLYYFQLLEISDHNKIIQNFVRSYCSMSINMTWRSSTLTHSKPLPTFKIKLFEALINRFLVQLQPSLGSIEKHLTMSRNRRTSFMQ